MTAMTPTERRLVLTGAQFLAFDHDHVPRDLRTDFRDTWYTARDLARPDHEHVWIDDTALCDPTPRAVCSRCGQRTDFDQ